MFLPFRLPAIARRSGEAGGEERQKTQSACGGKLPAAQVPDDRLNPVITVQIPYFARLLSPPTAYSLNASKRGNGGQALCYLPLICLSVDVCSNFLILRSKTNR